MAEQEQRVPYTDEELQALIEISTIVTGEMTRHSNTLIALLEHLVECPTEEHRALVAAQAGVLIQALMGHMRNIGWIEVELGTARWFRNPASTLAKTRAAMAALEERRAAALATPPANEEIADAVPVGALPGEEKPAAAELPQADHDVSMSVPGTILAPGTRTLN